MAYRECRTAEADIGMRFYLTDADGTGGRLKTVPEDFIVTEISKHPEMSENGRFAIADVTSRNWETNRLVRVLSRTLGISRERIGFAGTKDKRAVTKQLMSFECSPGDLGKIDLKDVSVSSAYSAGRGMRIGDLTGNSFEITVRGADRMDADRIGSMRSEIIGTGGFPNYFGVQRFGTARPITHMVGERIIRGDLESAVRTYLSYPSEFDPDDVKTARTMLSENLEEAVKTMPKTMGYEKIMAEHLVKRPGDHAGALLCLPSNLQMMFVHAYQSYLFNLMLSERMHRNIPINEPIAGDVVIPLNAEGVPMHESPVVATDKNMDLVKKQVSRGKACITITLFGSESSVRDGEMGDIERSVIEKESLRNEDFIVPGLPNFCSKGSRREILCPVKDIGCVISDETYTMSFSLPKGNYATCLMREFMKSEMHCY